jgi:hypothetical protein
MTILAFWQTMEIGKRISSFRSLKLRNLAIVAILVTGVLLLTDIFSPSVYGMHGYHWAFVILFILFFNGSYEFEVYPQGLKIKHLFFYKWIEFEKIKAFKETNNQFSGFSIAITDTRGKILYLNFDTKEQAQLFAQYLETVIHKEQP